MPHAVAVVVLMWTDGCCLQHLFDSAQSEKPKKPCYPSCTQSHNPARTERQHDNATALPAQRLDMCTNIWHDHANSQQYIPPTTQQPNATARTWRHDCLQQTGGRNRCFSCRSGRLLPLHVLLQPLLLQPGTAYAVASSRVGSTCGLLMIASTRPYSIASWGDMKKSRSVSRVMVSMD